MLSCQNPQWVSDAGHTVHTSGDTLDVNALRSLSASQMPSLHAGVKGLRTSCRPTCTLLGTDQADASREGEASSTV